MTTPRSPLFLAAAVALAIVMFPAAAPVLAQEDTPFGAISCSSNFGNPAELDKKYFHLAVAIPAEIASLEKSRPALSVAGGRPERRVRDSSAAARGRATDRRDHRRPLVTRHVRLRDPGCDQCRR